jgi:hypothetical protein
MVEVIDSNACEAACAETILCEPQALERELIIWPNPASEETNVKYIEPDFTGEVEFEMFDVLGRRVMGITQSMEEELLLHINVMPYAQGNYVLRLRPKGSEEWITRKLMVLR